MIVVSDKCSFRDLLTPRSALELLKESERRKRAAYAAMYGMSIDEVEAEWNGRTP